jgi:shikimate dehydrogenase
VRERFVFFGVSTHESSIMAVFPRWADALGLDAEIVGRNIPLGSAAGSYRDAVANIRGDQSIRGGLITSHKVAFYEHARDFFDELDEQAERCREISCFAKRGTTLRGSAKDPIIAARVLADLLPDDHWLDREHDALILGAGGAGTALSVALLSLPVPPARLVVTDSDESQLERLADVHSRLDSAHPVQYTLIRTATDSDRELANLRPGSLVVNATGVGKDVPGSPLTDAAAFPSDGIAWELNYRGDLTFLEQARRQTQSRRTRIENGWNYFIAAWVEVIREVFERSITPDDIAQLEHLAEEHRPLSAPGRSVLPEGEPTGGAR